MRSSGSSHWTFTQLDKELHYRHGDMGMHLLQGSPHTPPLPLSYLHQWLQRMGSGWEGGFLLETQTLSLTSLMWRAWKAGGVLELHFRLNTTVGCLAIATGFLSTFTKLADET